MSRRLKYDDAIDLWQANMRYLVVMSEPLKKKG